MERRRNLLVPSTYRKTTLGTALENTLDQMLDSGDIDESQKDQILKSFDLAVFEKFADLPVQQKPTKISAKSQSYNNVEDIWKFKLENVEIRDDLFRECSTLCRLAAINAA